MDRTHLAITLSVLVFIVAGVLGASIWFLPLTSEKNTSQTDPKYFSFSNTDTLFKSLQQKPEIRKVSTESKSLGKQQEAIQEIIQTWEERPGSNDFRTILETTGTQGTKTVKSDEVSSIFNTLIGSSLLDKLAQPSDTNASNNEPLWSGGYSKVVPIVEEDAPSKIQEEFRIYGNELATILNTFNLSQGDQTKLLNVFIGDREDTKQLKRLTDGYLKLATNIAALEVPEQLKNAQTNLITSYTLVGELLWDLTLATDDESLMERILIYNVSSEKVAKGHVSLITLFKSYGIVFQNHEPGRIFTFTP